MKHNVARTILFIISFLIIIAFGYWKLPQDVLIIKLINVLAAYCVVYETALQFVKVYYRGIYDYLTNFLDGNIRLNQQLHGKNPLTLYEKSKIAITTLVFHLLTFYISILIF